MDDSASAIGLSEAEKDALLVEQAATIERPTDRIAELEAIVGKPRKTSTPVRPLKGRHYLHPDFRKPPIQSGTEPSFSLTMPMEGGLNGKHFVGT